LCDKSNMDNFDRSILEAKFPLQKVVFGLKFLNKTDKSSLEHVNTYIHSGTIDPYYSIPSTIEPSVSKKPFL